MKKFNQIMNTGRSYLAAVSIVICACLSIVSCKDSELDQIATERLILNTLQINTTAELPLLAGTDSLLSITYTPAEPSNAKLVWKSDNEDIATVSEDGKVHAVKIGNAVISVSSTDGGGRTASITVQVIDHIDYIAGISLSARVNEIYQSDTVTVKATITPANATYKTLKWTSSDPAIATVSEAGLVTGIAKGNATITAAATDGSGKSQSIALTIKEVIPATDVAITTVISETLAIGQQVPVSVALTPSNATAQSLQWASNNEAVATVSAAGLITAVADGQATITVSAKNNPDIKASITVVVEAGKINDTFLGTSTPWKAVTANSTGIISNGKFLVTMYNADNPPTAASKFRGDFQRTGGAIVHAGNYPIIAFKFNRPAGTGNVIFDTNNGSYLNGNNKLTTIVGKDGVQVHYADLGVGTFGANAVKLSTTQATTLTTFQLKIADFVFTDVQRAVANYNRYEVYWVKSFKTVADLEAYINQ